MTPVSTIRKILRPAQLGTALVLVGAGVMLMPGMAYAHTLQVSGSASCDEGQITWTVGNRDTDFGMTVSTNMPVDGLASTIGPGGTDSGTTSADPGETQELRVTVTWDDNFGPLSDSVTVTVPTDSVAFDVAPE